MPFGLYFLSFVPFFAAMQVFVLLLAFFLSSAHARTYRLHQHSVGTGFYDNFDFQTIPDPTNGRVKCVPRMPSVRADRAAADTCRSRWQRRRT